MPQESVCFARCAPGPPKTVPAFLGLFPAQEMAFPAMVEAVGGKLSRSPGSITYSYNGFSNLG